MEESREEREVHLDLAWERIRVRERLECLARVWSSPRWISMFNRAAGNDGAGEAKDGRRGADLDLHEPREEIIKP
jgi:hypothetical protein